MKGETVLKKEEDTITIGQVQELGAALLKAIPKNLVRDTVQRWIGAKEELHAALRKILSSPPLSSHNFFSDNYIPEKFNGYSGRREHLKDVECGKFFFVVSSPDGFNKKPLMVLDRRFTFTDATWINQEFYPNQFPDCWGIFASTSSGEIHNFSQYETVFVLSSAPKPDIGFTHCVTYDSFQGWLNLKKVPSQDTWTSKRYYMYSLLSKWGTELAIRAFPECKTLIKG